MHPRRHGFPTIFALTAALPLGLGAVAAVAAQPDRSTPNRTQDRPQGRPGARPVARPDARPEITPASPEELTARLRERLDGLDTIRERLAATIERLDAGESFEDVFSPEDRRWFMRLMRQHDSDGWFGLFDHPGTGAAEVRRGGPSEDRIHGGRPRGETRELGTDESHGPWGRGRPEPLNDEQLAEVRAIINEHIPMLADRLKAAEEKERGKGRGDDGDRKSVVYGKNVDKGGMRIN